VIDASREAAKLAWTNGMSFAFYLDNEATLENDKTFIALQMFVGSRIFPGRTGIVIPDL